MESQIIVQISTKISACVGSFSLYFFIICISGTYRKIKMCIGSCVAYRGVNLIVVERLIIYDGFVVTC